MSFSLSCAVPADLEGAEDFRLATLGVPVKQLAAWMGVKESQITRWRQSGNVPDGQIRKLAKVEDESERAIAARVLRNYRERQAARDGAFVIKEEVLTGAAAALVAFIEAAIGRPAMTGR